MSYSCDMIGFICITIFAATALISFSDGQPNLIRWILDLDNNTITLHLTALNSSNNGMPIDCTAILIGPITGNISMAVRLPSSAEGLQVDESVATCDLGMEFRYTLENTFGLENSSNLFLYYNSSGAAGGGILLQDSNDMVYENAVGTPAEEVVPDSSAPTVMSFELLDLDDGVLILSFSQPINSTTLNFANISLQSSSFDDAITMTVPLTDGNCTDGCNNGRYVTVSLKPSDLNNLKLENGVCTYISNCYLHYTNAFVEDFGGIPIAKQSYCMNYLPKELTLDETSPSLTECSLDLSLDKLHLEFNEPTDVNSFRPSGVNVSTGAENFILTSASNIKSPSSSVVVIYLGLDADNIKAYITTENVTVFVSLMSLAFEDTSGNTINPISMLCTFIHDTRSPNVSSFILDLSTNFLQIIFDEPISMEHINISGFWLTDATNITTVSLSDSELLGFDDLELTNDCYGLYDSNKVRTVYIALKNNGLIAVKTNSNITYLHIDNSAVFDLSGNGFVSVGPIAAVDIIADYSPATVVNFLLDMNIGQLVLTFNDVVDVSTLELSEVFIQRYAYSSTRHVPSGSYNNRINSSIIAINLSVSNFRILKYYILNYGLASDINSTYLTIRAHAINDYRGVDIIAITDGNGIVAGNYIRDDEPPVLTSFSLDLDAGRIWFNFDEPIRQSSFNFSLFSIHPSSVNITNTSVNFYNGGLYVRYNNGYSTNFEWRLYSNLINLLYTDPYVALDDSTTNLLIMQGGVLDASGNPINTTGPVNVISFTPKQPARVYFSTSSYRVNENSGQVQIALRLTYSLSTTTTVRILTEDHTASDSGDYRSGPYTVTFSSGSTYRSFYISITDDNVIEYTESFLLTIDQSSLPTGISLRSPTQATVTISNDDVAAVNFANQVYDIVEGTGLVQLMLTLSNPSSYNNTIRVVNADGSATGNIDYHSGSYSVTFLAGMTSVSLNISIIDDDILENNENFYLSIDEGSLPTSIIAGSTDQTIVNILDDDAITMDFNQSTYRVNEDGELLLLTLVLSNPSSFIITAVVLSTSESATGSNTDYESGPYTITFVVGVTAVSFSISITDDDILEGNETFYLTIDPSSLRDDTNVDVGNTFQVTVIIVEDDSITVNFDQSTYIVDEDNGPVQPVLVLSNPSTFLINIQVNSSDGSALGEGVDYFSGPYLVAFPVGMTTAAVTVQINDNTEYKDNSFYFTLGIISDTLINNVIIGETGHTTVTIIDDESKANSLSFSESTYSIDEDGGSVEIQLILSNSTMSDVTIEVLSVGGSANGGEDYEAGPYTVIIPAGMASVLFNISIINDDIYEGNETFNLVVNVTSLPLNVTVGDPNQATITIFNDDAPLIHRATPYIVNFNQSTYSVDENSEQVMVTVFLDESPLTETTVEVFTTDGSATSTGDSEDYNSGRYNVTFNIGVARVSLGIPIYDDEILEQNEFFSIGLCSLPSNVIFGNLSQATVIIMNDDTAAVNFEQSSYIIDQNDGWLQPVLVLSIPSSTIIIVQVLNTDGSANRNDYSSGPYNVTILPGTTSTFFVVPILRDNLVEGNEEFTLTINTILLPSDVTAGHPAEALVTIVDGIDDTVLPFLPFLNQRQQLEHSLDGVSERIYIPNGFPFGTEIHTVAYIGANGVISFSKPFHYWYPSPFPGRYYQRRFYVVAPFWADHDIRKMGEVYYEVLKKGRSRSEDAVLNEVNQYVSLSTEQSFVGTFMILAEWRNVHPYPHGSCDFYDILENYPTTRSFINQRNTYQALVITDGKDSYAVFTYMCDLMQWSGLWQYPTIGYSAAGILFANHPLTGREEANEIDCAKSDSQFTNVIYKISADPDAVKLLQSECLSWYYTDIELYESSEDIFDFSKNQPACPCTWRQAWWDRRFRYFANKDGSSCYIQRFPNARGGTQECCYSTSPQMFGALVLQGRSSGGLLRFHPWWPSTANYLNYIEYDRDPQDICCLSVVGLCTLYHERRPSQNCEGYVPQRRFRGWGDPHMDTIDGRKYTFNGLGEYVLIRQNNTNFEFQGRTALAPNSSATIFSAFALREGDDCIEVGIGNGGELFIIKFSGVDVSDNLTSVGDNVTSSSSLTERSSNNSITVSFPSGIGITINYTAGLLVYTLEVPSSFEETTSGLLGNYNNDDSDEFIFRNGTMISNSSSDREIHQFGQSWQITSNESIFTYEMGEGVDTFSNPNHVPPFLDEILSNLMGNLTLTDVCGSNAECLFDFAQTGDMEVGMAAIAVENETTTELQETFSFPPNITAPGTFMATVGEESVYTFTVSSDSENINVIILHEGEETLPSGIQLNNPDGDSWTITWTPADNTSVLNLTIVAVDLNLGNVSSVFNPVVQLCACINEGNCTTNGLLNIDYSFIILNCECPGGYDGEFCQNDANGCEAITCLEGQQCFDYPAPLVGAECTCPEGSIADSDSKCIDVNECEDNAMAAYCTQICVNTFGSYHCTCYDGYRATNDTIQCEDINECEEYNDCHHSCNNTEGSYYCSCNVGFILSEDNRTCTAGVACSIGNSCTQGCTVVDDVEICYCISGYQLDTDDISCLDVNECNENPCDQVCNNTDGSFTCSCNNGYELDENGRSCNDIDECLSGPCPLTMLCNNNDGNYTCDCPDGTTKNGTDCFSIEENLEIPIIIVITPSTTNPSNSPSVPLSSKTTSSAEASFSVATSASLSTTSANATMNVTVTLSPSVIPNVSGNEFSKGAIAGIIVGAFFGLIAIVIIAMTLRIFTRKYKIVKVTEIAPDETSLVRKRRAYDIQMNNMPTDGDQD